MYRMFNKRIVMKKGNGLINLKRLLKKHAGQIGYYACVALVLVAVALAAERFRSGHEPENSLVLPAVELAEPVQAKKESQFVLPEGMELIQDYTSQPEWNHVHRQWETHAAVDFVNDGGQVRSFTDGIVRTIGKSGVYGGFVEVQTEQEYLLRYCSVDVGEGIVPGKKLKKGDVVGIMDDSMPGERYMDAHLHLEVWKDAFSHNIMELAGKNF